MSAPSVMAKFAGSVELKFHQPLKEGQYKLLEVTEDMLKQIQESQFDPGTRTMSNMVEFRGANTDEAALVTKDKTYSVRLVESSNTQMLVSTVSSAMFAADPVDDEKKETEEKADLNPAPLKKQRTDEGTTTTTTTTPDESTTPPEVTLPIRVIEGTVQHHYEAIEILPRLHVLRDLLIQRLYTEDEEEVVAEALAAAQHGEGEEKQVDTTADDEIDMTRSSKSSSGTKLAPLYTLAELRCLIQASNVQLAEGLRQLDAFEDESGHWRMLDPDYTAKVFDSLCTFFVEKQWEGYENLNTEECAEGLKELYPPVVTRQVIRMHSKTNEEGQDPNLFTLDATKVCLFHALQLFASQQPYPHVSFLADWSARVPAGMTPDVAMLRGHALCEVSAQLEALSRAASSVTGAPRASEASLLQWRHFPVASLSPHVKTRFAQLFDARSRWRLNEIEPYVDGLRSPGQTLEQLMLKQTRPISIVENGAKIIVYTRR